MIIQHYTTIEQSKKLVELGLNPDTADMSYTWNFDDSRYEITTTPVKNWIVPKYAESTKIQQVLSCWSLGALMDLLPPSIQTGEGIQNQYEIEIRKYWGDEENLYQIAYGNNRGLSEEWHDMINTGEKENLIDAAFQMICWLLKNSYIKKGG